MNSQTQRTLVALALLLVVGTPGYPEQKTADKKEAAQAKPGLEELFKNLDTNKDGHLTLGEFKATTKQPKKTAKVETAFKLGDKNDEGKLSFAEFGKMPVDGLATTPDNKGKGKATSGSFKNFLYGRRSALLRGGMPSLGLNVKWPRWRHPCIRLTACPMASDL